MAPVAARPVRIALRPSRALRAAILLLTLLGCAGVLALAQPLWLRGVLLAGVLALGAFEYRGASFGFPQAGLKSLEIVAINQMVMNFRPGGERHGTLLPESHWWPWLAVLRIEDEDGERLTLRLCRDCTDAESWRLLSTRVRWLRPSEKA